MATATVGKPINGTQLVSELRAAGHNVTSEYPTQTEDELTVEGDLTDQQLADALAAHTPAPPPPDPQDELRKAIEAATSLAQLKDALLGKTGNAEVQGRPT